MAAASSSRRRGSLPTMKLSAAQSSSLHAMATAPSSSSPSSKVITGRRSTITDKASINPAPPPPAPQKGKADGKHPRRHSIATGAIKNLQQQQQQDTSARNSVSRGRCNSLDKDSVIITSARSSAVTINRDTQGSDNRGRRRHSLASIDSKKELQSILKKQNREATVNNIQISESAENERDEDNVDEEEDDVTPCPPPIQAWSGARRGSMDADLPEGSDTFRMVMADFLPEVDEEPVHISTMKLNDCKDEGEEEATDEEEKDEEEDECTETVNPPHPPVRKIRWNDVVNVIS